MSVRTGRSPRSGRARIALPGATVLLTGATGGIGGAIAHALAARGARLLLSGRRAEPLHALAAALGGEPLVADLAVREDVDRLAAAAAAAGAGILVANAALPATGELTALSTDEIDRMLDVNLRAPIALARALAPAMVARGAGQLVFISSLSGKAASPASSLYAATKFGLRGFALGLREDLRTAGVGVSVIAPGFIREAGMFHDTGMRLPVGVGTRSPDEVAAAVVRAVDEDRAELDVAPLGLRAGAAFAGLAPELAAAASRRLGSARIATQMAIRQRHRR